MSYLGIGNETPNHPVEINGDLFISNVSVPFEIYSDYTGEGSLTDSRQIRLRVTPSETITSNSHIDMGIDNTTSDFFISNPVFDSTVSGNKNSFKINSQGNVTFLNSNVTCENNISSEQIYLQTLSTDLVKSDVILLADKIKINESNVNLGVIDVNYNTIIYPGITIGEQILRSSGYGIYLGNNQNYASLDSDGILHATAFTSFTGAHRANKSNYIEPGMIVSVDPSIKLCIDSVNNVVPYIKKSNTDNDENVCGVCSDDFYFNGVGEGAVWVCDVGGIFFSGDYITSCYISGYGKKQEDIYMQNYTVGKILENCDFTGSDVRYLSISDDNSVEIIDESQYITETKSVYKAQLVACTYHCG